VREDGTINRVAPDAQQSLLNAKIEGWKIITIDYKPFSDKLFTKKMYGYKNYTIEVIREKKVHYIS